MDLYPNLKKAIVREFGSLAEFAAQAGIPEGTVKPLLYGHLGPVAEMNARDQVEAALARLRPDMSRDGLWERTAPPAMQAEVCEVGGRRIEIVTTVTQRIRDLGPMRASDQTDRTDPTDRTNTTPEEV